MQRNYSKETHTHTHTRRNLRLHALRKIRGLASTRRGLFIPMFFPLLVHVDVIYSVLPSAYSFARTFSVIISCLLRERCVTVNEMWRIIYGRHQRIYLSFLDPPNLPAQLFSFFFFSSSCSSSFFCSSLTPFQFVGFSGIILSAVAMQLVVYTSAILLPHNNQFQRWNSFHRLIRLNENFHDAVIRCLSSSFFDVVSPPGMQHPEFHTGRGGGEGETYAYVSEGCAISKLSC